MSPLFFRHCAILTKYICNLLKNYSYKNLVDYFNRNYNITNNLKNTNIFIDSLYELNNYIKFKFSKLVQYLKIYESDKMKNNSELQKFIGILSSYKNFDTANKILDDLGINEEDFMKIIELLNISNVIANDKYTIVMDQYGNGYSKYKNLLVKILLSLMI